MFNLLDLILQIICIVLQCSSLLFIRLQFKAVWDYVQGGTDRVSYFDLLLVFLLYGIDVLIKLKFWGGTQQFSVLLHEISNDKRLRVRSSWGSFKVNLEQILNFPYTEFHSKF